MSMPITVPPSWTLDARRRRSTVVVGYDRSAQARAALDQAGRRAGPDGMVIVVYVTTSPDPLYDLAGYEDVVGRRAQCVEQIRDDVAAAGIDDARVEVRLASGPVAKALVGIGQAFEAAEIIVGFRPRGRLRSLLGRSVSRAVLQRSDRPVLLVPPPDEDEDTSEDAALTR